MKFYIVDAFSSVAFGGNPAGVIILEPLEDFPKDEIMLKTAAELRYSETAFVKILENDTFNIRFFTPTSEVDLCGHATIASFSALHKECFVEPSKSYMVNTKSGNITIKMEDDYIFMEMPTSYNLSSITSLEEIEELYSAMGIKYENILLESPNQVLKTLLPTIISTGLPDIMLPVLNLDALAHISPDMHLLSNLSAKYNVTGVHAFALTLDDPEALAHTRNFAPLFGIGEEAATGTASGSLAHYLKDSGIVAGDKNISFIQGESMKRPSKIIAKSYEKDGETRIEIGGTGVILAEGKIFI